ncbi:phasin family protein [Pusillimonas sp.]|uniref:phasin family protein n=1 Tax=Pusillimonas sp. TaxID=3040095 RepID=UPI0029AD30C0|nr:phasin family protein [Pusillimonas sp.]MDX3893205.1 phasin family protein [Pusillimonas sp.]
MEADKDNALETYQRQIEAAREISEALFEGAGRIENILIGQWRKAIEEQAKFVQATAAVRDLQGLAALHSAMFSHAPEEFMKTQQQVLNISVETQSKIYDIVNHCAGPSAASFTPAQTPAAGDGMANILYTLWQKSFQDALGLAALTTKSMPSAVFNPLDESASQKGNSQSRRRPAAS